MGGELVIICFYAESDDGDSWLGVSSPTLVVNLSSPPQRLRKKLRSEDLTREVIRLPLTGPVTTTVPPPPCSLLLGEIEYLQLRYHIELLSLRSDLFHKVQVFVILTEIAKTC